MIVETARLLLRPPLRSDVPALFEFLGDAQAMRYTHVDATLRQCRRRILVHEWLRRRNGYAPWSILKRDTGDIVGWGGLYNDPFDPGWGVEIGYFFRPAVWGQGYGLELVTTALEVADHALALPEVKAFVRPDNQASCRLLRNAGFETVRFIPIMDRLLFRRKRPGVVSKPRARGPSKDMSFAPRK